MGFVNQNRKPPTQEEIEEYCGQCADLTVLCCSNWLSSMLCYMTDEEIKDCLFAWLHYTQGDLCYIPITRPAQMLAGSMRPVIRNNLLKQNKAIEDGRKGANDRWNKERANKLITNNLQCHPIAPNATPIPKIEKEIEIENTPNPQEGAAGGKWKFLFDKFISWREHDDGCNLAWHSTDPEAQYVCSTLKAEPDGDKRADIKREIFEKSEKHQKAVYCSWPEWRDMWEMMQTVCKLNEDQIKIFGAIFNNNPSRMTAQILAQKAKEIAGGYEVHNLFNFLTSAINR